jgi:hypothetical protein
MGVVAAAADQPLLGLERGDARLGQEAEQAFHLGHDLRADAVAGKQEELVSRHRIVPRD